MTEFIYRIVIGMVHIDDMNFTFIVKPYKTFIMATVKLCALFSFLVFISFNPLITLFLAAVYLFLFYMTYIFINFCVKFNYKKIMLIIIFAVLYFLCFILTTNLRRFLGSLYFH